MTEQLLNNPAQAAETFRTMLHELTDSLLGMAEANDDIDAEQQIHLNPQPFSELSEDLRFKDFVLNQVFPSMAGRPEAETLMRGLRLEEFFMIKPGVPLAPDMISIFTYSREQGAYINIAFSPDVGAYQVYCLTKRMEDDVDTKRRAIRKALLNNSEDLFKSAISDHKALGESSASLNKSEMEANLLGKYASVVIGRVKMIQ